MGEIGQPILLLGSDVCSGGNSERRIDEEEHEDFTVARFLRVGESEGLDLVLVEVRECDAAICFGDHVSNFLYAWYAPGLTPLECGSVSGIRLDDIPVHVVQNLHTDAVVL